VGAQIDWPGAPWEFSWSNAVLIRKKISPVIPLRCFIGQQVVSQSYSCYDRFLSFSHLLAL
jgi:hypothetical protein